MGESPSSARLTLRQTSSLRTSRTPATSVVGEEAERGPRRHPDRLTLLGSRASRRATRSAIIREPGSPRAKARFARSHAARSHAKAARPRRGDDVREVGLEPRVVESVDGK
jgi:hypothetical protein